MRKPYTARLLLLLLLLALLFSFAACGDKGTDVPPEGDGGSNTEDRGDDLAPSDMAEKIVAGLNRNPDTVGWLRIPGTTIDDAVLQYKDNSYYLRLDEDKVYDIFGCYFMDYESVPQSTREAMSRNNIIYGHSDLRDNKDGKKFSQLFKYTDIDFVRQNPYIYYGTKDDPDMVWQVFSVFYTHIDLPYTRVTMSDADFLKIIDEARLRGEYIIDVPVTAEDKILTLSTCTVGYVPGDEDNYRLVIMAKLLPADAELSDSMTVEVNPEPKKS